MFVIDMNVSPEWGRYLDDAGHEAVHWSEIGRDDDPDDRIIAWAASHDHAVLTGDLDFGTLLARSGWDRPSVVQLRTRETRPTFAAAVLERVRDAEALLHRGALLTIGPRRARLKPLPLKS